MHFFLSRHPDTPCDTVDRIEVEVSVSGSWLLLRYDAQGRIADLVLPERGIGARADELWRTTCFEAFLKPVPGEAYCEINVSPSTNWAAYQFDRYREGMRDLDIEHAPEVDVVAGAGELSMVVKLALPEAIRSGARRLALSAVIEELSGAKSYWALAHPPGRPDFHHADSFVVEMEGVRAARHEGASWFEEPS